MNPAHRAGPSNVRALARRILARRASGVALAVATGLSVSCGSDTAAPETHPAPALSSIEPSLVVVGSASATVTLTGTGFFSDSRARLDGMDRTTTFAGPEELRMSLTEADVESGGTYEITVVNPPPGGGESGTATLTVGYPEPAVSSISPDGVAMGSGEVALTVTGSGFVEGASGIRFGGHMLPTTFESGTTLSTIVPGELLDQAAFLGVLVANPGPGGGMSNQLQFEVGHPAPELESASPTTITGGSDTRISVSGSHFTSTTELVWNGSGYPTQVVSSSVLYADVPASAFMASGEGTIEAYTPPPGGGTSAPIVAIVVDPPPRVSGFTPPSAEVGSDAFTLTVHGSNFSPDAEVLWNGVPRPASHIDDGTLEVAVAASDVAAEGTGVVVVRVPDAGDSHPVGFPIVSTAPGLIDSMSVTLTTADLAVDPAGGVVYAAVPSSAPDRANEVVALDPTTGAVLWSALVGSDPTRVVVSDDGSYLYVALGGAPVIARVDVGMQSRDLDITLPATSYRAEDLLVVPGAPTSIAVSMRNTCCSPRHEGVAVFDGATQRPLTTQGHTGSNRIEPSASGERMYGYNNETTEFGFRRILVGSSGVLQDGVYRGVVSGFGTDIVYDGGLIFSTRGTVVEPESRQVLGTIAGSGIMRPDVANGRVHFFSAGQLTAYHYSTFTSLGTVDVPSADGLSVMVRYGADGMAFGGGDRVVFVRSALVGS